MTKGMRSTEFYLTVGGTIAGVYLAMTGVSAGEIFASLSLVATYIGGRSVVKASGKDKDI